MRDRSDAIMATSKQRRVQQSAKRWQFISAKIYLLISKKIDRLRLVNDDQLCEGGLRLT